MKTLISGGVVVNEGRSFRGTLVLEGDTISEVIEDTDNPRGTYDKVVDATGCFVMPGVIDEHVHFREPGLTRKADIRSESRAAAYGGVTSFFEMPNTNPQTTSLETLDDKFERGSRESSVNYSFFFGATNENVPLFSRLDSHRVPGIKLFMGASTGNMLVDRREALEEVFRTASELGLPVMTHCEDTALINANMAAAKKKYGDDPDVTLHPVIRSEEACYNSSRLAVELANKFGTQLHIAHVSTARELQLLEESKSKITLEAVIAHLMFSDADYKTVGTRIKCNPAVKTAADRDEIRRALSDGRIFCVGTDHAPHELKDKEGGCAKAASGMPLLQYSLVSMLELVDKGVLTIEKLVELMAHNPATLFRIDRRGFIRKGYKADIAIVRPGLPFTVGIDNIQSKCGWSPLEGHTFQWRVETTICNGHLIYNNGMFDDGYRGEALTFRND